MTERAVESPSMADRLRAAYERLSSEYWRQPGTTDRSGGAPPDALFGSIVYQLEGCAAHRHDWQSWCKNCHRHDNGLLRAAIGRVDVHLRQLARERRHKVVTTASASDVRR